MKIPQLKIANITAKLPIIQGGMAVKISTSKLAAAVAEEGGIGIIAGTGMSVEELICEIQNARKLTKGIIGVNVLFAVKQFGELVKAAIREKVDLVISGAGFSRDMFTWGRDGGVPIVPIVSSSKLAKMAQKLGAAAVVVEGFEAGGHLGTDRPMREVLKEVISEVNIPVIGAGGVINGMDIKEVLNTGASGVQMGTRFAASLESNASYEFKNLYISSKKEDIRIIKSPVGLPGRAIMNDFLRSLGNKDQSTISCIDCLKRCGHNFCIMEALNNACIDGDFNKALVFAGENVHRIKEILSVKKIIEDITYEMKNL